MSFICIVCRDLVTAPVGGRQQEDQNNDIVVTKCGHLYHFKCLNGWFNRQDFPRQECPYCKSPVGTNEYQRIFPSGDEETDAIINKYEDAKTKHKANCQLQEEINERTEQLVDAQAKHEEEMFVHDLLKFEHLDLLIKTGVLSSQIAGYKRSETELTNELHNRNLLGEEITTQFNNTLVEMEEVNAKQETTIAQQNVILEELKANIVGLNQQLALRAADESDKPNMPSTSTQYSNTLPKLKIETDTIGCQTDLEDFEGMKSKVAAVELCMKLLEKEKSALLENTTTEVPPGRVLRSATQKIKSAASTSLVTRVNGVKNKKPTLPVLTPVVEVPIKDEPNDPAEPKLYELVDLTNEEVEKSAVKMELVDLANELDNISLVELANDLENISIKNEDPKNSDDSVHSLDSSAYLSTGSANEQENESVGEIYMKEESFIILPNENEELQV